MKSKGVFFLGNKQLEIREMDVPEPQHNEVQVKSVINGICMMEVWQYGLSDVKQPIFAGHEGVGVVIKTGSRVKDLNVGDYVYCDKWSEFINMTQDRVIKLPACTADNMEDYLLEPASCAVTAAAYLNVYPGDRVIVFGAGYMGLLLVQLLGQSPVSELIVADLKQHNLALASAFGATETLQIGTAETERRLRELEEEPLDIAVEGSGAGPALDLCTKLTRRGGKLGIYSWHHHPQTVDTSAWHTKGLQVLNVAPGIAANDLPRRQFRAAERLIRAGVISQRPMITHRYKLEEAEQAMGESTARGEGFIKSILTFG